MEPLANKLVRLPRYSGSIFASAPDDGFVSLLGLLLLHYEGIRKDPILPWILFLKLFLCAINADLQLPLEPVAEINFTYSFSKREARESGVTEMVISMEAYRIGSWVDVKVSAQDSEPSGDEKPPRIMTCWKSRIRVFLVRAFPLRENLDVGRILNVTKTRDIRRNMEARGTLDVRMTWEVLGQKPVELVGQNWHWNLRRRLAS